ncbi:MAG: RluA family pseudouridine synthase [Ruminococcaceae bacterium]|nr:RluA family pseudouridine synthase [Oscillospiraceae bacterium]
MRILEIRKNDAGQRLDKFLQKAVKTLPIPLMYRLIRQKKIKVNRKRAEQNYVLQEGDTVQLFISEDFFTEEGQKNDFMRLKPRLHIVYEDENMMLVDKKPGMPVHADDGQSTDTLIDHVKAYLYQKGEYDPTLEQSFAPALCNRIDRNTGGIVIAAKTAEALRILNEKIRQDKLKKQYYCVCHGIFQKKQATLTGWLVKDSAKNTVTVYDKKPNHPEAKDIITKYRVVKEKDGLSLLEVHLVTGRTHQIRAHLSHIGHPLLGDGKYGVNRSDREKGYKFQALYSHSLTFLPDTENALSYLEGKTFTVDDREIPFLSLFL